MRLSLIASLIAITLVACSSGDSVNVYSSRHYDSDRVMYEAFEKETGIRVRFREARPSQLLETMKAEGENGLADVILLSDVGTFWQFQSADLIQPFDSTTLSSRIPSNLRHRDGYWYGFAKRFRGIAYDPRKQKADEVSDYGTLAQPKFKNQVCARSSANIYNLSLLSEFIIKDGAKLASEWASSVVKNFARPPQGGDTAQLQSIAAGECSIAVVNHYYWVRLKNSDSESRQKVAQRTALAFPDQSTGGTHVNITGAALARFAKNKEGAIKFIEWLSTAKGQSLLVEETKEFPIVEGVPLPEGLEVLPPIDASNTPLDQLGPKQSQARKIYIEAGWE